MSLSTYLCAHYISLTALAVLFFLVFAISSPAFSSSTAFAQRAATKIYLKENAHRVQVDVRLYNIVIADNLRPDMSILARAM